MDSSRAMSVEGRIFIDDVGREHPRAGRWGVDPIKAIIQGARVGRVSEPWSTRGDVRRVSWVDVPPFEPRADRKRRVEAWVDEQFPEIADSADDSVRYEFCGYEGEPPIILCQINWAS